MNDQEKPDQILDLTRDICPMTFVRTRLALDRLQPGQTLLVQLQGDEPARNVPRTVVQLGHTVLRSEPGPGGRLDLWLRRN